MLHNRKSILIVSNYYQPEMGAAPKRITTLAQSLKNSGHNVRVICPLPNYPDGQVFKDYRGKLKVREMIDGVHVDRLWIFPSKSKSLLFRTMSMISFAFSIFLYIPFIRRSTVDTVIVQSPPLFVSFSAVLLGRYVLRKQICLNVSDLWPQSALELGVLTPGRMHKLLLWMEKIIYHKSDLVIGQSDEIIQHVSGFTQCPKMVYRNLPNLTHIHKKGKVVNDPKKIVYAGLLGFAQGVLRICEEIDFNKLGVEFHIYGKGMEENDIRDYIASNPEGNIYFHGSFSSQELQYTLSLYDAALVPLRNRIYGAVPSKIFELIHLGIPIIFAGGGEGATIIENDNLGFTSKPNDMTEISTSILKYNNLDKESLDEIHYNLAMVAEKKFGYVNQFKDFINFLDRN